MTDKQHERVVAQMKAELDQIEIELKVRLAQLYRRDPHALWRMDTLIRTRSQPLVQEFRAHGPKSMTTPVLDYEIELMVMAMAKYGREKLLILMHEQLQEPNHVD